MDKIEVAHDTKTEKLNVNKNADEGGNVVDKLPKEVIGRILSFLPTKEAVKTSILSKKWECAWMSVFNLDFKDRHFDQRTDFMNFVERVLVLRDASDIQTFSLFCAPMYDDESRINTWISAAIKHSVQEIFLYLYDLEYDGMPFKLPSNLFNCQSLKWLELSMPCEIKLPSTVSLPSLKYLKVSRVVFLDDLSILRLFSGCPNIKSLSLDECVWKNVKGVIISLPMLESLYIEEHFLQDLQDHSSICHFVISGANLSSFCLVGTMKNDYCLCSSSLVEADIDVEPSEEIGRLRDDAYRLYKLLRGISDVKSLNLTAATLELLSYAEELLPHMPFFQRLTRLDLHLYDEGLSFRAIGQSIVRNSPLLDCRKFGWFLEQ